MTDHRRQTTVPTRREIDISPLRRLLAMAGPANAPTMIAAFIGDLKSTDLGLDAAWNGPDCAALRMHSHVLIALAGTVGDTGLQSLAQSLNSFARDQALDKIHAMKEQIMRGVADLINTLAALPPTEE